jgi:hypothetical protein
VLCKTSEQTADTSSHAEEPRRIRNWDGPLNGENGFDCYL